jgi:hypothetical protein
MEDSASGNGKIVISKKFISWALGILATCLGIIISIFLICDRVTTKAEAAFNEKFDKRYPVVHAPCSTTVSNICQKVDGIDKRTKDLALQMKILLMLKSNEITWEQKQMVVDEIVKNDSISYDAAYELLKKPNSSSIPRNRGVHR